MFQVQNSKLETRNWATRPVAPLKGLYANLRFRVPGLRPHHGFPRPFQDHILPEKIHILNVCFMVNGLTSISAAPPAISPIISALLGENRSSWRPRARISGLPGMAGRPRPAPDGDQDIAGVLTAGAYITTDLSDNQITGFNPEAMQHLSDYRFEGVDAAAAYAIVAPGGFEDMLVYTRAYKAMGLPYIFDPGQSFPAWEGGQLREMVAGALALIVNDYELEMFGQKTGLMDQELLELAPTLIVTRGEEGSYLLTAAGRCPVPAVRPSQVKDPTGAGDAYRAGLLKGLVLGLSWEESTRLGAVLASFCVEQQGTQEHRLEISQFWERYRENFGPPPLAA